MTTHERDRRHEQVPVKVNAFVDKGIAPVVEALNAIAGVVTLDSCQQTSVADGGQAVVYFTYGRDDKDWRDLAALVDRIAARLRSTGAGCGFAARLEWWGSNDQPRAQLVIQPEHVADVALCLRTPPEFW